MKINKTQAAQTVGSVGSLGGLVAMFTQLLMPMQAEIAELQAQLVGRCDIDSSYYRALAADQTNLAMTARDVANRYVTLSEHEPLSEANRLRLEQKRLQETQFLTEATRLLGLAEAACND